MRGQVSDPSFQSLTSQILSKDPNCLSFRSASPRELTVSLVMLYTETYAAQNVAQRIDKNPVYIFEKLYYYKLESIQEDREFLQVTLHSSRHNGMAYIVPVVDLQVFADGKDPHPVHQTTMIRSESDVENEYMDHRLETFQVFTAKVKREFVCKDRKSSFRFIVHFYSLVQDFQYQLRDSQLADQLWSTYLKREETDVEFEVAGRIFHAH